MRLHVVNRPPWDVQADVLAVTVAATAEMPEHLAEVDRRLGGALGSMRSAGAIKGSLWETRLLPARDMGARLVLAVGLGEHERYRSADGLPPGLAHRA